jgi:hypothetical protein
MATEFEQLMELQTRACGLLEDRNINLQVVPFHPLAEFSDFEQVGVTPRGEGRGYGVPQCWIVLTLGEEFDTVCVQDPSEFVSRSPFPVLHLLRQADVDSAESGWVSLGRLPGDIPEANSSLLRGLGWSALQRTWAERSW